MDDARIERGGKSWVIREMGPEDQVRFELRIAHLLGPALAAGIGSLTQDLAGELLAIVAEIIEPDGAGSFDLAHLVTARTELDSSDPKLRKAWRAFLKSAPKFAGDLITGSIPEFTDRVRDPGMVLELFELAVIGQVFIQLDTGALARVSDWPTLQGLGGKLKWQLLKAAAQHNYPWFLGAPPERRCMACGQWADADHDCPSATRPDEPEDA